MCEIELIFLPEEILSKIFTFLPESDLLNCTKVCRKFNQIISDSSKILGNVCVTIKPKKKNFKLISKRKYSNFKLEISTQSEIVKYLNHFVIIGAQLKILDLVLCSNFKISELNKVLSHCTTLIKLTLEDRGIEVDKIIGEFAKIKLKHFCLKRESKVLEILTKCSVEKFTIDLEQSRSDASVDLPDDFKNSLKIFLVSQKYLKNFQIGGFFKYFENSTELLMRNIEFKLEFLTISNGTSFVDENFQQFISHHCSTLKSVKIENFTDFRALNQIADVKELEFIVLDFQYLQNESGQLKIMRNIKYLTVCRRTRIPMDFLNGKFPNLEHFDIENKADYSTFEVFESIIKLINENVEITFAKAPNGIDEIIFEKFCFKITRWTARELTFNRLKQRMNQYRPNPKNQRQNPEIQNLPPVNRKRLVSMGDCEIYNSFYIRAVYYGEKEIKLILNFRSNDGIFHINAICYKHDKIKVRKTSKITSLAQFKDDILKKIFLYLNYKEILKVTQVCKKFSKIICESTNFLAKTRILVSYKVKEIKFMKNFQEIKILNVPSHNKLSSTLNIFKSIWKALDNIFIQVNLNGRNQCEFQISLKEKLTLESVEVFLYNPISENFCTLNQLLGIFHNYIPKKLIIVGRGSLEYLKKIYSPEIEILSLNLQLVESFDELNSIAHFSNLKSLSISQIFIKDNSNLNEMKFIEHLKVENFGNKIREFDLKFPNLKSLEVKFLMTASTHNIFNLCKELENLTFSDCNLSLEVNLFITKKVKFSCCYFLDPLNIDCHSFYELKDSKEIKKFKEFLINTNLTLMEVECERVFVPLDSWKKIISEK